MTPNMNSIMIALEKKEGMIGYLQRSVHWLLFFFSFCFVLFCLFVCLFCIDQDYLEIQQARYKITLTRIVVV